MRFRFLIVKNAYQRNKECQIAIREIKEAIMESLKVKKINRYTTLIKRKRRYCINKKRRIFYTSLIWLLRNSRGKLYLAKLKKIIGLF